MNRNFYLWGVGGIGKRAIEYLAPLGILEGLIDSDKSKHGQLICGIEVKGYESVRPFLVEASVIIAHFASNETETILNKDNIKYWRLSEFITMWYWEEKKQNAIGFLDFPITTRCSLNCRDCMQFIPYQAKHDVSLVTLEKELELLFKKVSFVGEISIIGGEPFLHKHLLELLEHIEKNYVDRIGSLVITTNGTIIPDQYMLECCRAHGVFISISDYSETIPWIDKSISTLELNARKSNVRVERKRWDWKDPGRFGSISALTACSQTHMQLADMKIWYCTLMAAGYSAGFCTADNLRDYYDLLNDTPKKHGILNCGSINRTSQCKNCLYPHNVKIRSAIQN